MGFDFLSVFVFESTRNDLKVINGLESILISLVHFLGDQNVVIFEINSEITLDLLLLILAIFLTEVQGDNFMVQTRYVKSSHG